MQHMLKKIIVITAVLALLASLAGCSCGGTPAATPTPTMAATAVPTPEIIETSPDANASPDLSNSPDANASPDLAGTATIENFKEGTP